MPLFTLAHMLDIEVYWRDDMADSGLWDPVDRTIALRVDLDAMEVQSVLAHELGHAVLGHTTNDPKSERLADEWAANMLLSAAKVAHCAALWPDSPEKWCDELEVTPDILRAWMAQPDNYARAERRLRLAS